MFTDAGNSTITCSTPPFPISSKVLSFRHDHLNQQVGNGECSVLA
ncbi:MAG TPA: hypothetical protein VFE58_05020 [Tepidisphaeraceae bacterium]|jgi:hypothetical protein|nr:hypothetical protein [Tepidisphaeraceae bacterium]